MDEVVFNPFEDGYYENPYEQYAVLREKRPVGDGPLGTVLAFRYGDVRQVVQDPALSSRDDLATSTDAVLMRMELFARWMERGVPSMMNTDPPQHTRLRGLVARAFTPGAIAALRGPLEKLAAGYMDSILERQREEGSIDAMADLAFPLPCEIISELLGVPIADRAELQRWSLSLTRAFEAILDPADVPGITEAGDHLNDYVTELVTERRANPRGDLISAMAAAEGDDRLTAEELIDQVILIYVAGHTTVSNFLGTALWHLLNRRSDYHRFRDGVGLARAVDELLRFEPPTQFIRRITRDTYRLGDCEIPAGRLILGCVGSANHDPDAFGPTADTIDLDRDQQTRLLSLGGGIHLCLGAALARLEGEVVLSTMARAFPDAYVAGPVVWNRRITFRGLEQLPVDLHV